MTLSMPSRDQLNRMKTAQKTAMAKCNCNACNCPGGACKCNCNSCNNCMTGKTKDCDK